MGNQLKTRLLMAFVAATLGVAAQRSYKPHSVLSTGTWAKIAVRETGVYKLDMGVLKSLGLPASIASSQLQVWGRREAMLPEANKTPRTDDLEELAIQVVDGGDGVLNNSDYALFFAQGPDTWTLDSANRQWHHQKNKYSTQRYYYVTVNDGGKRMPVQSATSTGTTAQTSFDEHLFHELDSVNFLSSGKEWFGEELRDAPGHSLTQTFADIAPDAVPNSPLTLVAAVAARAIGSNSRFTLALNNQPVQQLTVAATTAGPFSPFAQQAREQSTTTITQTPVSLQVTFGNNGFNTQGWINWWEVFYKRRLLLPSSGQLAFRSTGNGATNLAVENADAATQVWDITDPAAPVQLQGTLAGTTFTFTGSGGREYMGFWKSLIPEAVGPVPNQDLHNTTETDYLIITHPLFATQAQRLAQFHQQRGLRTTVVTTEQIFNEFSAGLPDPTALRDFVKLYYDRYRATWAQSGKYLLLFGKGSFDPKNRIQNNTAFVPVYESAESLDPLNTYTSDDFFALLDESEDVNVLTASSNLDICIGRVPAKTPEEVAAFVDKVLAYQSPAAFGPWRTALTFVADDEDANLHLQDAEALTATTQATAPLFNIQKIYLDAYRQEGGSAGSRYPQATETSTNALYNGTLIWNYTGHGGPNRLAEEVVLDQSIVNNLSNPNKLPLLVTATCDFAPYDNPTTNALGEDLLVRPKTGAIALTTTTRVVFAFSNRVLNDNYLRTALQKDAGGNYKTLGEALRITKKHHLSICHRCGEQPQVCAHWRSGADAGLSETSGKTHHHQRHGSFKKSGYTKRHGSRNTGR